MLIKLKIPTKSNIQATTDNTVTWSLFPRIKAADVERTVLLKYNSFKGSSLYCIGELPKQNNDCGLDIFSLYFVTSVPFVKRTMQNPIRLQLTYSP